MKEGGPIKSARELIERAQIQLVLHDRLIWENGYSEGRFHSMEERKQQQCLEAEWIVSHGLDTVMSRGDTRLLNQEIETVEDPIRSQRSFECEANLFCGPVPLWKSSLRSENSCCPTFTRS